MSLQPIHRDFALTADGRGMAFTSEVAEEFAQEVTAELGFSLGTYRYNRRRGFPTKLTSFHEFTPESMTGLLYQYLQKKPAVAEVLNAQLTRLSERGWQMRYEVRLRGGAIVKQEQTI